MSTDQIIQSVVALVGGLLVLVAKQAVQLLADLKRSIDELNVKIAVIIERVDSHEKRIARLEE